ncbi:MAG: hypothetical protein KGN84_19765 [Acidobacteriota bacterium]|nr:hypothetical protein [Acidobacteriota bacterium]
MFRTLLSLKRRSSASAQVRTGRLRNTQIVFPFQFQGCTALFSGGPAEAAELDRLKAEAIAAPLGAAIELAGLKMSGQIVLPCLTFAFVVFTDPAHPKLSRDQRDCLWRAFRVPVFEQFRAADGAVLARECEAHDGLHLVAEAPIRVEQGEVRIRGERTGLTALLDTGHCECGDEHPRLTIGGAFAARLAAGGTWAREAAA